jgi:hypothetical protein
MATERRLGPRFGSEAGLILAAAAFAALLELSWPGVVAVVLCAWLAVAIFEVVRAHVRPSVAEAERTSPRREPEHPHDGVRPEAAEPKHEPAEPAVAPHVETPPASPEERELEPADREQRP